MNKIIGGLLVCFLIVLGLIIYLHVSAPQTFSVDFFDVGQGDAALIKFADGEKMLVDCGPGREILSKLGGALPFFDRTIDYLVVSHPDNDHYGGCTDVLKRYQVKNIIQDDVRKDADERWKIWDAQAHAEGAVLKNINGPEAWTIASTTIEFLAPDPSLALGKKDTESNNASIVFKLTSGAESFLFTGDMEQPLEKALMEKYCLNIIGDFCPKLRAQILKIGHHGSDSSSGEEFLSAVHPLETIISVGQNSYGHPSLRTLKKLERLGAEILRTDEKGDIILK